MTRFFSTLILFFLGVQLSSQGLNGIILDRKTSEELIYAHVFLIDPVDSLVIGYTQTDYNGSYHFHKPLKPLKSNHYQLRIANIYYPDTSLVFTNDGTAKIIQLEPVTSVDWMTVKYNKQGSVKHEIDLDFNSWVYISYNTYVDSSIAITNRFNDSVDYAYSIQVAEWEKEARKVDSLNKLSDVQYEIPMYPPMADEHEAFIYDEIDPVLLTPTGGWAIWIDKLIRIHALRGLLNNMHTFYIEFGIEPNSKSLNYLKIIKSNGKEFKMSKRLLISVVEAYPSSWEMGQPNWRLVKFNSLIKYRMHFVFMQ